jgi:hypothetical protein
MKAKKANNELKMTEMRGRPDLVVFLKILGPLPATAKPSTDRSEKNAATHWSKGLTESTRAGVQVGGSSGPCGSDKGAVDYRRETLDTSILDSDHERRSTGSSMRTASKEGIGRAHKET